MRKFLSPIIALTLVSTCLAQENHGSDGNHVPAPQSRVDRFIDASHAQAKARTERYLSGQLLAEVNLLLEQNELGVRADEILKGYRDAVESFESNERRRNNTIQFSDSEIASFESTNFLIDYLEDYRKIWMDLRLFDSAINESRQRGLDLKGRIYGVATGLSERFQSLCERGVVVPQNAETLGMLRPIARQLGVFGLGWDSRDGIVAELDNPTFTATHEGAMLLKVGGALTMVGTMKAHTGKWYWTGQAFNTAAQAASTQAGKTVALAAQKAAYANAALFGLGIVAVTLIADHFDHLRQSTAAARTATRAFREQATTEDTRAYYIEACQEVLPALIDLPERLERLEDRDPQEIAELERARQENQEYFRNLMEHLSQLSEAADREESSAFSFGQENDTTESSESIINSPEFIEAERFLADLNLPRIADAISFLLRNQYETIHIKLRELESIDRQYILDQAEEAESRVQSILSLIQDRNYLLLLERTDEMWRSELALHEEIAEIYSSLDAIVLRHATLIVESSLSEVTEGSWGELAEAKRLWNERLISALTEFPDSTVLNQLLETYQGGEL